MENAVTYKDIYLSFGEVISIDRLEITQSPGHHGQLILSAVLDGEKEGEVFDEVPESIIVHYMADGEEKILFKGIIADSSMKRLGNHRKLEVKAYDATYLLDTKRKTRSFQNISRTNHSVIEEVMQEYPGCICMKHLPKEAIGRIWFQYEETDWEFLCRFLSAYSDSLYADATYHTARFQAGLSPEDIDTNWENAPYRMSKNLERYDYLSQNGFEGLKVQQFVEYSVDSYDLYTLGSRLNYKGRTWYIGALKRVLREGLLVNTYELQQREGLLVPQGYNRRITGISVDGNTKKINRDKVQVTISGDMTTEQGTYWFPFSTVAASADGSGWYSMPEEGDTIRVYFPTCDEKEGYVITKHGSHMPAAKSGGGGGSAGSSSGGSGGSASGGGYGGGSANGGNSGGGGSGGGSSSGGSSSGESSGSGGSSSGSSSSGDSSGGGGFSGGGGAGAGTAGMGATGALAAEGAQAEEPENPMDDPSKRNIFTKDGCVVQMVPTGVILSAGKASITMKKSGDVIFNAPQGISIYAGEKLTINGRKITMQSGTMVELKDDAGANIRMTKNDIKLRAKEIFEN